MNEQDVTPETTVMEVSDETTLDNTSVSTPETEVETKPEDTSSNKKKEAMRIVKFFFFSCSAGLIQLGSDALMVEVFKWAAWLSYLIALILSVLWNFTLNRKFTFKSASNVPIAMLKVVLFYAVFTPLSTWWTHGLVDGLHWNNYLVLFLTMTVNLITEYLYQRFFVFKK